MFCVVATLKELRRVVGYRAATLSGFLSRNGPRASPGLPKRNPGLKLADAFSVNLKLHQYPAIRRFPVPSAPDALREKLFSANVYAHSEAHKAVKTNSGGEHSTLLLKPAQ